MMVAKIFLTFLVGSIAVLASVQFPANAAIVEPCVTSAAGAGPPNGITFLPINGGTQTYCQSAFGWSDTWFATSQPTTYDAHQDVLSGDNAPNLLYKTAIGTTVGSGNPQNFIGPWLDGGSLNSNFIGSNWKVLNDISASGNTGTSKITLNGLDLTITTTVAPSGQPNEVTEQFHFTNNTSANIADILFSDYYNFHSNGSTAGDIVCPTTTFDNTTGTVTTTGKAGGGCSPIVINGTMVGSQLPLMWDLGLSTAVLADVAANTYNNALGPFVGDGAADVVWDVGALAVGASTDFTITKNFVPIGTPEPTSLTLLMTGLLGIGLLACRKTRTNAML
jgi:hypothetical protein